jgi:hypothetical protein
VSAARGCLQGGVLRPAVVDDLLWELNSNGYYTVGYADDIAILINGKFLQTVSEVLQTALCTAQKWCERTNPSINPNNTVIIPFTRKRNIKGLKEPILLSKTIQLSSKVKVSNKAYKATWTCRVMFGKTWGLKPKVIYWIYTVAVTPTVTCAATVWWFRVKLKGSQAELSKLQRMACLGITGAIRTAPTAATEVLLGLPPLHLTVEE